MKSYGRYTVAGKPFGEYGDAQRHAWRLLNLGAGRVVVRSKAHDGRWFDLEAWTIGPSGKYAHEQFVDPAFRRDSASLRRDPAPRRRGKAKTPRVKARRTPFRGSADFIDADGERHRAVLEFEGTAGRDVDPYLAAARQADAIDRKRGRAPASWEWRATTSDGADLSLGQHATRALARAAANRRAKERGTRVASIEKVTYRRDGAKRSPAARRDPTRAKTVEGLARHVAEEYRTKDMPAAKLVKDYGFPRELAEEIHHLAYRAHGPRGRGTAWFAREIEALIRGSAPGPAVRRDSASLRGKGNPAARRDSRLGSRIKRFVGRQIEEGKRILSPYEKSRAAELRALPIEEADRLSDDIVRYRRLTDAEVSAHHDNWRRSRGLPARRDVGSRIKGFLGRQVAAGKKILAHRPKPYPSQAAAMRRSRSDSELWTYIDAIEKRRGLNDDEYVAMTKAGDTPGYVFDRAPIPHVRLPSGDMRRLTPEEIETIRRRLERKEQRGGAPSSTLERMRERGHARYPARRGTSPRPRAKARKRGRKKR